MAPPLRPAFPLSVIVPLVDTRGYAEATVRAWLQQSCAPTSFELVLVRTGHKPALEQRLRGLLRPHDQIVLCRSTNEATVYNAGAQAARGAVLLLTEAHVVPCPEVAQRVQAYFADHADECANLPSGHLSPTPIAQLDEELYHRETADMTALGDWRCVGLRGFAIRAHIFRELGPFAEEYGRFAEIALALRIVERGYRIGLVPGALVWHGNITSYPLVAECLRLGAQGETTFWQREPALAAKYYGEQPPWLHHTLPQQRDAWLAWQAVLRSLWTDRRRQGGWRKLLDSLQRLPRLTAAVVLSGWWPRLRNRLGLACRAMLLRHHLRDGLPQDADARAPLVQMYLAFRQACVRHGVWDYLARHEECGAADCEHQTQLTAAELHAGCVRGIYEVQQGAGGAYRWTAPVAVFRLRLPLAACRVSLDLRLSGNLSECCLGLLWNGHAIAPAQLAIQDGVVSFAVPEAWRAAGAVQRLVLTAAPQVHSINGSLRWTGVAIRALAVHALAPADGKLPLRQQAA